ncbi:MAG: 50S ribosomal protein P1 [archaeon]
MEYIYAAMLLHSAGKKVAEADVGKVLDAAGVKKDDSMVKALVAALDGVNIEDAIKKAATVQVAAAAPAAGGGAAAVKEAAKEDTAKEDEKKAEEAAAGLGSLFG